MSLTVFFALCVLGADFMIYLFFKLLYSEKYRTRPRRVPREYDSEEEQTSPLYRSPARKSHPDLVGKPIPADRSRLIIPTSTPLLPRRWAWRVSETRVCTL